MGCASSGSRRATEEVLPADPRPAQVTLTDGSTVTVGLASDSFVYCVLAGHGETAVILDARETSAFQTGHLSGAWSLGNAGDGTERGTNLETALRSRCNLRTVVVCGGQVDVLRDPQVMHVLWLLRQAEVRPKGSPLVMRGGMGALSQRFHFCLQGARTVPASPAEIYGPELCHGRPSALYLGSERCVHDPSAAVVLAALGMRAVFNLTRRPCPVAWPGGPQFLHLGVRKSSDPKAEGRPPEELAQEAFAKLRRQSGPCLVYGPGGELAVALFLVDAFPRLAPGPEEAMAWITRRLPSAQFDAACQAFLRARAKCGSGVPISHEPETPLREELRGASAKGSQSTRVEELAAQLKKRRGGPQALATIQVALNNVLQHPEDIKYRRLRGDNPRVRDEILAFFEAVELLRLAGFVQDGRDLNLPPVAPLQGLRDLLTLLFPAAASSTMSSLPRVS